MCLLAGKMKLQYKNSKSFSVSLRLQAVEAAFKQSGVIRAFDLKSLLGIAGAFANQPLPENDFVAIITNAGFNSFFFVYFILLLPRVTQVAQELWLVIVSKKMDLSWPSSPKNPRSSCVPCSLLRRISKTQSTFSEMHVRVGHGRRRGIGHQTTPQ